MGGWGEFATACAGFLLSHALPARPAPRRVLAAALGERGYLLAYSGVSLGMLAWLVAAAGRAPHIEVWPPAPWQAWVPNLLMPLVCLLLGFGVAAPNPLSFGGVAAGFDPQRPGIAGVARHPLLLAITLWAAGHVVPNGGLAHLLLFGAFAVFAVLGMRIIDRRRRRMMGEEAWARLAARTSGWPLAAWLDGRWRPAGLPCAMRLGASLLLWLLLLAAHPVAIGVSPLPP